MSEHDKQAERLESEADRLEERSDELGEQIEDAREDWERKKADDGVPGAVEDALGDASGERGTDQNPPPEAEGPG